MTGTIDQAVRWWARVHPARTAIQLAGDALSFGELDAWSDRAAAAMAERGARPGDRIAVFGPNSLAWCVAAVAIIKTGAMLVPLNYRYTQSELASVIADCAPRLILTEDERAERVAASGIEVMPLTTIANLRDGDRVLFRCILDPAQPAVMAYTSGSTAQPKGVVFSHAARMAYAFEAALSDPAYHAGAKALAVAPLFTGGGTVLLLEFLVLGITMILEPDFNAERALRLLVEEKIDIFFAVPTFFERIAAAPGFADADLSHVKLSATGGARVSRELLDEWRARGVVLRQLYGLTEGGGTTTLMDPEGAIAHPEKCGRGGPLTLHRIVDPDGRECPSGVAGEIEVRGPGMMSGYWNNAAATQAAMDGAWLRTGDIGVIDEAGDLTIVDRLKDIIISGGLNISPIDIETVVAQFAGIEEVAVIAAADARFGETPMAVVHAPGGLSIPNLIAHCNSQLADYKVPRYVAVETEPLPRLATGKISKRALKEKYKDAAATMERVR